MQDKRVVCRIARISLECIVAQATASASEVVVAVDKLRLGAPVGRLDATHGFEVKLKVVVRGSVRPFVLAFEVEVRV